MAHSRCSCNRVAGRPHIFCVVLCRVSAAAYLGPCKQHIHSDGGNDICDLLRRTHPAGRWADFHCWRTRGRLRWLYTCTALRSREQRVYRTSGDDAIPMVSLQPPCLTAMYWWFPETLTQIPTLIRCRKSSNSRRTRGGTLLPLSWPSRFIQICLLPPTVPSSTPGQAVNHGI